MKTTLFYYLLFSFFISVISNNNKVQPITENSFSCVMGTDGHSKPLVGAYLVINL
ncbi:MAG: hypothetical protein ABI045_06805 [Flavobacteriales bacterium]